MYLNSKENLHLTEPDFQFSQFLECYMSVENNVQSIRFLLETPLAISGQISEYFKVRSSSFVVEFTY